MSVIIIVGCEFLGAQQRRQIELLSSELKEVKKLIVENKQEPSDHSGSSHPRIPSSLSVSYKNIARKNIIFTSITQNYFKLDLFVCIADTV